MKTFWDSLDAMAQDLGKGEGVPERLSRELLGRTPEERETAIRQIEKVSHDLLHVMLIVPLLTGERTADNLWATTITGDR